MSNVKPLNYNHWPQPEELLGKVGAYSPSFYIDLRLRSCLWPRGRGPNFSNYPHSWERCSKSRAFGMVRPLGYEAVLLEGSIVV